MPTIRTITLFFYYLILPFMLSGQEFAIITIQKMICNSFPIHMPLFKIKFPMILIWSQDFSMQKTSIKILWCFKKVWVWLFFATLALILLFWTRHNVPAKFYNLVIGGWKFICLFKTILNICSSLFIFLNIQPKCQI